MNWSNLINELLQFDETRSEARIAARVGTYQTRIHRIKKGQEPPHGLGEKLIALHKEVTEKTTLNQPEQQSENAA